MQLGNAASTLAITCVFAAGMPLTCHAQVNILNVGPDGAYSTVSNALAEVLADGYAVNWIRVQAGVTTTETVTVPTSWTTGTIWISGGWDAGFTSQSGDPTDTVISGGLAGVVFRVRHIGGLVIVSDLSVVDGSSSGGGGFEVDTIGPAATRLQRLAIHGNASTSTVSASGGGVQATLRDTSSLEIEDCSVSSNIASGPGASAGGGLSITAMGANDVTIARTTVTGNLVATDTQAIGVGIRMLLFDQAEVDVSDTLVTSNSTSSALPIDVDGAGMYVSMASLARLGIHRTWFTGNRPGPAAAHEQLQLYASGHGVARVTDSIVADGASDGITARADEQAEVSLTNLTVADHTGRGLVLNLVPFTTASLDLANTIAYANAAADLWIGDDPIGQHGNLIGVDPEFTDAGNLDYRCEPDSVAVDAGVLSPPGGLGAADLRGGIRVLGSAPDAGAFEGGVELLFSDGFDLVGTDRWSAVAGSI